MLSSGLYKHILLITASVLAAAVSISGQVQYTPKTGDLIFQDVDCGDFCNAIEKVTTSIDGKTFSHVGVVYVDDQTPYVFEACGLGVLRTPLNEFTQKSLNAKGQPKIYIGRVKEQYSYTILSAISVCMELQGRMYDDAFDISNDQYYCSELVYFAFADSTGQPLFELSPMTFIDPATKKTFPVWVSYFRELGLEIPEGESGLNPGSISRSDKIEIVYRFY